ncbi:MULTISPECIES: hypothetical protein [Streptomyces]|uniref:hypothetical protein n=1 Tax=Streptomyces TaxID=1883 RepID=UPI0021A77460|nr:hypothetical protein [Streptomyces atratus]MCT2546939.1 hypothetical protein [Streptomyces atratus]
MKAPIVVHGLSRSGGRRVAIKGKVVGLARNDSDLVDDPHWIEWRDGQAHCYEAARKRSAS